MHPPVTSQAHNTAVPPLDELTPAMDEGRTLWDPSLWDWLTDEQSCADLGKINEGEYEAITAELPHIARQYWEIVIGWEDEENDDNATDEIISFVEEMGTASRMEIFLNASDLGIGYTATMEIVDILCGMDVLTINKDGRISLGLESEEVEGDEEEDDEDISEAVCEGGELSPSAE